MSIRYADVILLKYMTLVLYKYVFQTRQQLPNIKLIELKLSMKGNSVSNETQSNVKPPPPLQGKAEKICPSQCVQTQKTTLIGSLLTANGGTQNGAALTEQNFDVKEAQIAARSWPLLR